MSAIARKIARKAVGKKRKAVKKPKAATQKGVKFSKGKDIKDGAPSRAEQEIEAEQRTARVAKGSRAEKITTGKSSAANFIRDQLSISPGMAARRKQDEAFRRKIANAKTEEEKELLRNAQAQLREIRAKYDERAEAKRRRNISRSTRGKPRKEVDNYQKALEEANESGVYDSELTKDLTPKQKQQVEKAARAAGRLKVRDSAEVDRQMIAKRDPQDEDVKMGKVILGTRRREGMNKGGAVKKSTGAHDYRKGGMVISTVDRRKKK